MCFTFSMRSWDLSSNSSHPWRFPRSIRRPLVIGSALVSVLALAAGCSSVKSALETPQADASEVSVLFSVLAPSMDVAVSGDAFTVSVPANSSTAWFTDRPDRNAGTMTVADLVSTLSAQGFDVDPPNAAVAVTVNGEQHQHVVELSNPVVAGGVVAFRAVDVGDDASADAVAGRNATHSVIVGHFENANLFIDNATQTPCASSITAPPASQCLLADEASVTVKITTSEKDQCVLVSSASDLYVIVSVGPYMDIEIPPNPYIMGFNYTSGKAWKVEGYQAASLIGFGTCP